MPGDGAVWRWRVAVPGGGAVWQCRVWILGVDVGGAWLGCGVLTGLPL